MATVFVQTRKREKRNSYVVYYKDPSTSKLRYFKTFRKQKEANNTANGLRSLIDIPFPVLTYSQQKIRSLK